VSDAWTIILALSFFLGDGYLISSYIILWWADPILDLDGLFQGYFIYVYI
jgi:hypothetical protein